MKRQHAIYMPVHLDRTTTRIQMDHLLLEELIQATTMFQSLMLKPAKEQQRHMSLLEQ